MVETLISVGRGCGLKSLETEREIETLEEEEMENDGIMHRSLEVNGIQMHVAEKGAGPVVLMLHGFPELWYSWRRQIVGLAARGYRAVAPDMRGYGGSDVPPSPTSYTYLHTVGDIVALIDALGVDQVYLVGHDWGALVAWYVCLFRPDKIKALLALSVSFIPPNPTINLVDMLRNLYGDNHYIVRFQEPAAMEEDIARIGSATFQKILLTLRGPGPLIIPEGGFQDWPDKQIALPSWLSEEDINYFAQNFDKTGYTGALNYYRALKLDWELTAPWIGAQVKVPAIYIAGELDLAYTTMGTKEYIKSGSFKKDVPYLEDIVIIEGAAHFIQQERPDEITDHIYNFIQKY